MGREETTLLTLDLPTAPYWLDLPHGVRVEIRPMTTAVMAAAQTAASWRLTKYAWPTVLRPSRLSF